MPLRILEIQRRGYAEDKCQNGTARHSCHSTSSKARSMCRLRALLATTRMTNTRTKIFIARQVQLGANTGAVSAVYARLFISSALPASGARWWIDRGATSNRGRINTAATRRSTRGCRPRRVRDEAVVCLQRERLMERLPEVAHHEAESLMRTEEVRELTFSVHRRMASQPSPQSAYNRPTARARPITTGWRRSRLS